MSDQSTAVQQWEQPQELAQRIKRMHELQKDVMKPDVDYGIIPGTQKPTLYKPGAELLKVTFGLSDRVEIEDLGTPGEVVHYRVKTELYDRSGMYLGCGFGECSSNEEKYKWRRAVCDEEWDDTDLDDRRTKYGKKQNGHYTVKQVRVPCADVANTILKMGKKRSQVDAVLNVLGASRIYNQDLEDMSPELLAQANEGKKSSKPDVTPTTEAKPHAQGKADKPGEEQRKKQGMISDKQVGRIFGIAKKAEVSEEDMLAFIKAKWGLDHFWQLSWKGGQNAQYNNFCKLLEEDTEKFVAYVQSAKRSAAAPPPDADQPADDDASFSQSVIHEALRAGYVETDGVSVAKQVDDEIDAEFSIKGGLDKVPAEQMGQVFDFYHKKAEEHANASV